MNRHLLNGRISRITNPPTKALLLLSTYLRRRNKTSVQVQKHLIVYNNSTPLVIPLNNPNPNPKCRPSLKRSPKHNLKHKARPLQINHPRGLETSLVNSTRVQTRIKISQQAVPSMGQKYLVTTLARAFKVLSLPKTRCRNKAVR